MPVKCNHNLYSRESNAKSLCLGLAGAGLFFKNKKGDFDLKKISFLGLIVFVLIAGIYLVSALQEITSVTLSSSSGNNLSSDNLTILEAGCPSTPQNWNVAMSDYLWVNSLCNITGFNITFSGVGNFTVNSTIYVNQINNLSSNMTVFMTPNATIWMGAN